MCLRKSILFMIVLFFSFAAAPFARDSYEDYMRYRDRTRRDRPLSEIRTGERQDVMDELRGAVRDEIDSSINKERKARRRTIDESELIKEVRQIVREEIEDAIRIKEKKYLNPFTIEIGGFISYQSKGLESDSSDNNNILQLFPMFNFFLMKNVAIGLKGEASFNLTQDQRNYNMGIGPQYVFPLDKNEEMCFYTGIYAGASMNSALEDKFGYRWGNEFGMKFILTSGVILNLGVMIVFDSAGDNVDGFQNIVIPTLGISAWF